MSAAPLPIPIDWVEAIHSKLAVVYGQRFTAQYPGLDIGTIRAAWAHELAGVSEEGIAYALANLPADFAPNVLQFRNLAHCAPRKPVEPAKQLAAPQASPERVARAVEALKALRERPAQQDPKAWAHRLRERERRGDNLTLVQKQFWREALGVSQGEAA